MDVPADLRTDAAMQTTAQYIEQFTAELSRLAKSHQMHDLAYLLSMASEEARLAAGGATDRIESGPAIDGTSPDPS